MLRAKREERVGAGLDLRMQASMYPFALWLMNLIGVYLSSADLGIVGGNAMVWN
jgi:hypothetical protein